MSSNLHPQTWFSRVKDAASPKQEAEDLIHLSSDESENPKKENALLKKELSSAKNVIELMTESRKKLAHANAAMAEAYEAQIADYEALFKKQTAAMSQMQKQVKRMNREAGRRDREVHKLRDGISASASATIENEGTEQTVQRTKLPYLNKRPWDFDTGEADAAEDNQSQVGRKKPRPRPSKKSTIKNEDEH